MNTSPPALTLSGAPRARMPPMDNSNSVTKRVRVSAASRVAIQTKPKKRISAMIPAEDLELLRDLAESQGISATDALRRAIRTTDWVRRTTNDKASRLVVRRRGEPDEGVLFVGDLDTHRKD